jgi:ABC-type spermidine/putrescine transport system, permease component I
VSAPEPRRSGAVGLLAAPVAVLGAMLVVPLLVIVANSLVHGAPGVVGGWPPTLAVYADVLGDPRVLAVLGRTLVIAAIATACAVLVAYPIAMVIVTARSRAVRAFCTIAALTPLLVSVVLRTFGWQVLLGAGGPVAAVLTALYGPRRLLGLIGTDVATVIGLTHMLVPFVLLGLLPALDRIDPNVLRAADTLGASRVRIFWRVVVPLSRPGLVAGAMIGFALGCTAYVTPALLGGQANPVFAALVYERNFVAFDWNTGAALSVVLLAVVVLSGVVIGRFARWPRRTRQRRPVGAGTG